MKNTNYSVKKSVKKYQSYGILLLALLFCGSVHAEFKHYVGGFGQVGEWSLMPSSSSYSSSLGVAGGLGFAYELQAGRKYKPFRLLFDLGVCATYGTTSYNKTTNAVVPMLNQKGLNGIKFDYIYDISDRKDKYTDLAVHVPVLIGVQYRRFYALAGVKVYAHMWTQTKSTTCWTRRTPEHS
jgi:hypothetical protein